MGVGPKASRTESFKGTVTVSTREHTEAHAFRMKPVSLLLVQFAVCTAFAQAQSADERARSTEAKMTDDERFSLIISLIGPVPSIQHAASKRQKRRRAPRLAPS